MPRLTNQFLDDPNRQVRFASSDLANDQQAFVAAGIAFFREAGGDKVSFLQRRMSAGKVGVVVREFTVLVAAGNAGRGQQRFCLVPAAGSRSA